MTFHSVVCQFNYSFQLVLKSQSPSKSHSHIEVSSKCVNIIELAKDDDNGQGQ